MSLNQVFVSQSFWGKLIGAFFGYLIAGPAGALFGLLIGNFFDKGLRQTIGNHLEAYHQERRPLVKAIFFEATFTILGYVSKSDGRVSEQEIQMTRQLMKDMRLKPDQEKAAQSYFSEGKKPGFTPDRILSLLFSSAGSNLRLIKLFIDIQYRAARIDGLTPQKRLIMNTILRHFAFDPLHQQSFYEGGGRAYGQRQQQSSTSYHQSGNSLSDAYALLESSPVHDKQDIKRAYRRLMSKHHPDKLAAKGLSPEKIKKATEKTQAIRKAYELICQSRGW